MWTVRERERERERHERYYSRNTHIERDKIGMYRNRKRQTNNCIGENKHRKKDLVLERVNEIEVVWVCVCMYMYEYVCM